ncbi:MAG: hypothetical protein WCP07_05180 [bacterium]|jgi:hypothetical protein
MKQKFMVYYWLHRGDKGVSICEKMTAESLDEATKFVQRRMEFPSFAFDSEREGRVILRTEHIQFIEIEVGEHCGEGGFPEDDTGI